jgi:hypothetical protein
MGTWLEVDVDGLRKTLSRKGKVWALHELIQNSWDAEATQVNVTLTKPKDGTSTLTCVDNAPGGFADLTHAHTLFAESDKKDKVTKRGRFSAGDKYVLALMRSAAVTSTTGQVVFKANGQRATNDSKHTEVGSEFKGILNMSDEDYDDVMGKIGYIIPPVPTFVNGQQVAPRTPVHSFKVTLPTEVADDAGILRSRKRETTVNLYALREGETAHLYEMGIPVVPIDENLKWHVDIGQKVPLNIERDNVNPSYLRDIYTAVASEKIDEVAEEDASAPWLTIAAENTKTDKAVVKKVFEKRFGANAVIYDQSDLGSNREATAAGKAVVPKGSMTPEMRKNVLAAGVKKAGEGHSTKFCGSNKVVPEDKLTEAAKQFRQFVINVAPLVLPERPLKGVKVVDDDSSNMQGCTKWLDPKGFEFTVNVAQHDVTNWAQNYSLFIHELAHFYVQRNDHLLEGFWRAVDDMGGRLAAVALTRPELFPTKPSLDFTSIDGEVEDMYDYKDEAEEEIAAKQ